MLQQELQVQQQFILQKRTKLLKQLQKKTLTIYLVKVFFYTNSALRPASRREEH